MKDDNREKRWPARYFRYAIPAFVAVLVASLGVALIPREAPAPAEPPFSEQARAAALTETMELRAAARQLADSASGAERQHFFQAVTLLTTQARALILPGDAEAAETSATTPPGSTAATKAPPVPASASELVAALSASGLRRTSDAETADAGLARLLAAVGSAQLLQASSLALAAELPAPPAQVSNVLPEAGSCRNPTQAAEEASLSAALSTVVKTEMETVYGYQVALTRLDGEAAALASELLARHEAMVGEAGGQSRLQCVSIPPREAGYTLGGLFLEAPASGLGSLESGTLPVYGDLVALSEGPTRKWAIASLLSAARRAVLWGAVPGPVPGLVLDTAQLPPLPESSPSSTASGPGD